MVSELPRQRLVFIVDEEYLLASNLAEFLRMEGFEARSFAAPLEALEAAHESPPELLIADVALRPISGIELANTMREICPACKVLLFSSFADTNGLLEAADATGHDFALFPGPVHLLNLMEGIQGLIQEARPDC